MMTVFKEAQHLGVNFDHNSKLLFGTIVLFFMTDLLKSGKKINFSNRISNRIFVVLLAMVHPVLSCCTSPGSASAWNVYVADSY